MKHTFHSVRGTVDFYPPQSFLFEELIKKAKGLFEVYGYSPLILPHLEEKGLFQKGIGQVTDIVEKQMFQIADKDIVLRPEGTAQVARFFIEHALHRQGDFYKFYYAGAMFRGERPQRGRLREFHHLGAEAIGSYDFHIDAEIIELALRIIEEAGIKDFLVQLNSLGCQKDKERFALLWKESLLPYEKALCVHCQARLKRAPLRVLDCKNPSCRRIISGIKIREKHLCDECLDHFTKLRRFLDERGIKYEYDQLLVRGLGYYTHTVFEITSTELGAQDAIGAGGRYNHLIKNLGGPDVPAVGFALGVERILLLLAESRQATPVKVFLAHTSEEVYEKAVSLLRRVRDAGISADMNYQKKSLKAQLKQAQKKGIPFVLITGDEELKEGCIIFRDMRKSIQEKVKLDGIVNLLKEMIR